MKPLCIAVVLILVAGIILSACSLNNHSGDNTNGIVCETSKELGEVCGNFEFDGPIQLFTPIPVTITVKTTMANLDLFVDLANNVEDDLEYGHSEAWRYTTQINETRQFHTTITFLEEGRFTIELIIKLKGWGAIFTIVRQYAIDDHGVTFNPSPEPFRTQPPQEVEVTSLPLATENLISESEALPHP